MKRWKHRGGVLAAAAVLVILADTPRHGAWVLFHGSDAPRQVWTWDQPTLSFVLGDTLGWALIPSSDTTVTAIPPEAPRAALRSWPNPARDHVWFACGRRGAVVSVYDVAGRRVAVAISGGAPLDARRLANGVYFAQVVGIAPARFTVIH